MADALWVGVMVRSMRIRTRWENERERDTTGTRVFISRYDGCPARVGMPEVRKSVFPVYADVLVLW